MCEDVRRALVTISVNKGAPAPKNENKGSVIKGTTKKMFDGTYT